MIVAANRPVTGVEALREATTAARTEGRPLLLRDYKDDACS
jgi:hypothetical protein